LTVDHVGVSALTARGLACATEPGNDAGYGMVICDSGSFARGTQSLDPHGSLLVFFARGEITDPASAPDVVARVRCPEGAWWLVRPRAAAALPEHPAVSLVVIVQDQARALAGLVGALLDIAAEPSWELVVIDRGSFDATADLMRNLEGDILAFRTPRDTSHTHATWLALQRARGELIAILDPDLLPAPGLITALQHAASLNPEADVFAGPVIDDPVHMLALRRSIVHGHGDDSPDAIAHRLRTTAPTLVPAFTARRG
jgi:hypothetical protein